MPKDDEIAPKRHENHNETVSFQQIPDEIILDILLKLPVRSLLRFKSVCKSWYDLISSSNFVINHTKLSVTDPNLSHHVIIFKTWMKHKNLMSCPLFPVLSSRPTDAFDLNCCLDGVNGSVAERARVVGCCNGLVCVVVEMQRRFFLWNPATRNCYELPKPDACSSDVIYVEYGFGYDEGSSDYKAIAVIKKDGAGDCLVEVYSRRTGRWKRIQDVPRGVPRNGRSTFVNGCLYMLWRRISGHIILVSLDLATEMFTVLSLPPDPAGGKYVPMALGALGECLCVFYNYHKSHAKFWVMNEHNVKDCWTKLASVSFSRNPGWIGRLAPVFIAGTGEILMVYDSSCLALYDVKNNTFKLSEIRNVDGLWEAKIYVESLVSPHGDSRCEISQ